MNVTIARLESGYFGHKGWRPARLVARADGHLVTCTGNGKGWACKCPDPACDHLNAVAALIAPEVLAELEADSDHHLREQRRPHRPTTPRPSTPRRRRAPQGEA